MLFLLMAAEQRHTQELTSHEEAFDYLNSLAHGGGSTAFSFVDSSSLTIQKGIHPVGGTLQWIVIVTYAKQSQSPELQESYLLTKNIVHKAHWDENLPPEERLVPDYPSPPVDTAKLTEQQEAQLQHDRILTVAKSVQRAMQLRPQRGQGNL